MNLQVLKFLAVCLENKMRAITYSWPTRVWPAKQAGNYGVGLCGSHSQVNR